MEQQFATRAVTGLGETLPIFALRMMMAKRGMLRRTVQEVAVECSAYIDDLLESGRLPVSYQDDLEDIIQSSGVQLWLENGYGELFHDVLNHLRAQRQVAQERTYPAVAEQLLNTLATQPQEFAKAISYLHGGSSLRCPRFA